jgi:hypothetical protein
VLPGLGHDALIRRHHEQDEVNPGRAGHHGAHQILMARDIHYPGGNSVAQVE